MPYIKEEKRQELEPVLQQLGLKLMNESSGVWNYAITALIRRWFASFTIAGRYEDFERVNGLLESIKLEFWRRMMVPYEEVKIEQNGDVF